MYTLLDDNMSDTNNPNKTASDEKYRAMIKTFIVVAVLIIAVLLAVIIILLKKGRAAQDASVATQAEMSVDALLDEVAADAPANERPSEWYGSYESSGPIEGDASLDEYVSICSDVYARIKIDGCDIDYPIVYCADSMDPFYLTHDINGNASEDGMIFTDSQNAGDLSDPLTMIYGSNPDDGTMFAKLHAFRDADFFADNDSVTIYTGDAQLIYKVYACFIGSADNPFVTYDFQDPEGYTEFFDSIGEIRDLSMNIRQEAKPSVGDHVIGLVTHCSDENKRLFVYAVLDEVRY